MACPNCNETHPPDSRGDSFCWKSRAERMERERGQARYERDDALDRYGEAIKNRLAAVDERDEARAALASTYQDRGPNLRLQAERLSAAVAERDERLAEVCAELTEARAALVDLVALQDGARMVGGVAAWVEARRIVGEKGGA